MTDKLKAAVEWLRTVDRDDDDYKDLSIILAHLDAEPERIARAREEQREADAHRGELTALERPAIVGERVRTTPLDATPLADEIRELRAQVAVFVGSSATLRRERDEAVAALRQVLASAFPNRTEHPAMWRAWRDVEAVLAKYPEVKP